MKRLLVSVTIAMLLVIAVVGLSHAASTKADAQLAFKGQLHATETHVVTPPTMNVTGSGSGTATQLGYYTMTFHAQVNIPTLASSTSSTWVASNGDTISATGSGQGSPTSQPGVMSIVEKYTITGGTGRFAHASGSFAVQRLVNRATGISSGTISGTIVIP